MTTPKEVTATAQAVLDGLRTYPDGTYPDESRDLIARAILAERERCAAEVCYPAYWHTLDRQDAPALLYDIRSRIKAGEAE